MRQTASLETIMNSINDTIAARATPEGKGGIGVIRISGKKAAYAAEKVAGKLPAPREAAYLPLTDREGRTVDHGIVIYFQGPRSYTGEDVTEIQCHGGQFVIDMLLEHVLSLDGIRMAEPGEFTKRAFLNGKLDLTEAEAVADLIDASSREAARSAANSLSGAFSRIVDDLTERLTKLRAYVEASLDFPDEDIDFMREGEVLQKIRKLEDDVKEAFEEARQGVILKDGMNLVIAGRPNAGKSSLLNLLAGSDRAIVTDIAGTTRDLIEADVNLDGLTLHVTDTAGLHESDDTVEKIGIDRAWNAIRRADHIIYMIDSSAGLTDDDREFLSEMPEDRSITVVLNKIDKGDRSALEGSGYTVIPVSIKTGEGIGDLKEHLKKSLGYRGAGEGSFTARRRHLDALERTLSHLKSAEENAGSGIAPELAAEELRLAQNELGEITGKVTSDDLLGVIFSTFCIGK